MWLEEGE